MKAITSHLSRFRPAKSKTAGVIVRHRQDLLLAIGSGLATVGMAAMAAQASIPNWEISLFRTLNELPDFIYYIIWIFMQYGMFFTIPAVALIAFYFRQKRLAVMLLLGGVAIYFGALVLKEIVGRGRPDDLIPD